MDAAEGAVRLVVDVDAGQDAADVGFRDAALGFGELAQGGHRVADALKGLRGDLDGGCRDADRIAFLGFGAVACGGGLGGDVPELLGVGGDQFRCRGVGAGDGELASVADGEELVRLELE